MLLAFILVLILLQAFGDSTDPDADVLQSAFRAKRDTTEGATALGSNTVELTTNDPAAALNGNAHTADLINPTVAAAGTLAAASVAVAVEASEPRRVGATTVASLAGASSAVEEGEEKEGAYSSSASVNSEGRYESNEGRSARIRRSKKQVLAARNVDIDRVGRGMTVRCYTLSILAISLPLRLCFASHE